MSSTPEGSLLGHLANRMSEFEAQCSLQKLHMHLANIESVVEYSPYIRGFAMRKFCRPYIPATYEKNCDLIYQYLPVFWPFQMTIFMINVISTK